MKISKLKIEDEKLYHVENYKDFNLNIEDFYSEQQDILTRIYDISEIRMGWEVGRFAIYKSNLKPELILNPFNLFAYWTHGSVKYHSISTIIFIKILVRDDIRHELPILVLDLIKQQFALIRIINSLPYEIVSIDNETIKLVEKYRDNRFCSYNNFEYKLSLLAWYSFESIEDANKLYFETNNVT